MLLHLVSEKEAMQDKIVRTKPSYAVCSAAVLHISFLATCGLALKAALSASSLAGDGQAPPLTCLCWFSTLRGPCQRWGMRSSPYCRACSSMAASTGPTC